MHAGRYKKLYYVPGLISLLLVPLLFIPTAVEHTQKLKKRVLEVNAWHPSLAEHYPFPERDYKEIALTRDAEQNKTAIANTRVYIKQLYANEDTINGIRYNFQDASYGTYVSIVNSLKVDSTTYSAMYGNSIWVFNNPKPKEVEPPLLLVCGTSSISYYEDAYSRMDFSEKVEYHLAPYLAGATRLWPALALLLLLALLSLKQVIHKTYT